MLYNVESKALDAALKLVVPLPDTVEDAVDAAAMDANGVVHTGVNAHHFTVPRWWYSELPRPRRRLH